MTCSVDGCTGKGTRRGLCGKHYARLRAHGTTDDPVRPSRHERFWSNVDKNGPLPATRPDLGRCWIWTGYLHRGYGQFHADDTTYRTHRITYEELVGPIPEGLEIDHLCRVRSCCNPAHLEPVTRQVNVLRSEGFAAKYAAQTHCSRGHEFTPENTYISSKNQRECRTCHRDDERARRKAQPPGPYANDPIGGARVRAVINEAMVVEMCLRLRRGEEEVQAVAASYGINASRVSAIWRGKAWKHVQVPRLPDIDRRCAGCSAPLPRESKPTRKYCSRSCRERSVKLRQEDNAS